jgi:eukaryotic-like serine/threonine-protein kinase
VRPLAPGRRIGDHEVIAHLTRSNVLDVYDAWSRSRGCRVVLKTLRPDRLRDARARRALLREGRLLVRLTHPHLVRGYEVLDEPRPTVVLETLRGATVSALVEQRERRLEAEAIAHLGLHLCAVVGYLHDQGVLHLDVKPSNVIAEAGRAKLIDLSLARKPGRMRAGLGTWCYAAPEQARGGTVDAPADVWGIGGVLFEAATGACAFDLHDADDDHDHPQLARRAEPVRRWRRGLPATLAGAIDACLDPDPGARPTLAALAAACEDAARLPTAERRLSRS